MLEGNNPSSDRPSASSTIAGKHDIGIQEDVQTHAVCCCYSQAVGLSELLAADLMPLDDHRRFTFLRTSLIWIQHQSFIFKVSRTRRMQSNRGD